MSASVVGKRKIINFCSNCLQNFSSICPISKMFLSHFLYVYIYLLISYMNALFSDIFYTYKTNWSRNLKAWDKNKVSRSFNIFFPCSKKTGLSCLVHSWGKVNLFRKYCSFGWFLQIHAWKKQANGVILMVMPHFKKVWYTCQSLNLQGKWNMV